LLGFKVDDSGREQYDKGIGQTKEKQQSLTASFLKAQVIYGAAQKAAGAAFGFVRDSVIGAAAETERYRVTLGTMMGDQEKANQIIHDLDYSPVSDFYGTANAIGGLQGMVTFGMQAEEASDILTRIGDIAQGNSEAFVSMSNNMGQVFAKGKADATDLKQFVMQGFDVVGEVSKQSGKSRAEIEKAGVTCEQTAAALKALTSEGGKYEGMLAKQMNTLGGVLKQFDSLKAAAAEAIGTGISEELKELLKYILEIGRAGQENFVNVFAGALKEVIHWIFQIIIMWKVLCYRIEDMGDAFAPVKKFFSGLKDAAGDALTGIMILAAELGKLIAAAFKPVQAFASPIIKELGAVAKDVFTAIAGFIRPLAPMVQGSAGFFGVLGQAISGLIKPALIAAGTIKGIKTGIDIGKGAFDNFNKAVNLATGIQGLFKGNLTQAGMAFRSFGLPQDKIDKITEGFTTWKGRLIDFKDGALNVFEKVGSKVGGLGGKIADVTKGLLDNAAAAWVKNTAKLAAHKIATVAMAAAQKAAAIASKIWAGIQWLLNAAMAANPIIIIILAVIALIAVIVLLVKNWDTVKEFFIGLGKKIAGIFTAVVEKIKQIWQSIVGFFSGIFNKIKGVFIANAMKQREIIMAAAGKIKEIWEGIKKAVSAVFGAIKKIITAYVNSYKAVFTALIKFFVWLWEGIASAAKAAWEGLKSFFTGLAEAVKSVWSGITEFFSALWDGIVNTAMAVWGALKSWFSGLIEGIKNIWNGISGFFSGLWEALKEGPAPRLSISKTPFSGCLRISKISSSVSLIK
jgi:phage-related protein